VHATRQGSDGHGAPMSSRSHFAVGAARWLRATEEDHHKAKKIAGPLMESLGPRISKIKMASSIVAEYG